MCLCGSRGAEESTKVMRGWCVSETVCVSAAQEVAGRGGNAEFKVASLCVTKALPTDAERGAGW